MTSYLTSFRRTVSAIITDCPTDLRAFALVLVIFVNVVLVAAAFCA